MKSKLFKGPYYSVFYDAEGHSHIIEDEELSEYADQFDCHTDCLICPGRYTCTLSPDFVEPFPVGD